MRKDARAQNTVMTENEITQIIVEVALKIHTSLGPGMLESLYERVLAQELKKRGLSVSVQQAVPVVWESLRLEVGFCADLIVEGKVIVELRSVETTTPAHKKHLITYLRLTDKRLGLLINFGAASLKEGITRVVNGLDE